MKKSRLLVPVLMLALFATAFAGTFSATASQAKLQPVAVPGVADSSGAANASVPQPANPAKAGTVEGVDCSQVYALGINRQMNLRASRIMVGCGLSEGGNTPGEFSSAAEKLTSPAYGGSDVDVVTGGETYSHVTQAESMNWVNGSTVVINYNDSRSAPSCYSGTSYSNDGGATFTRILPNPFCSGHGTNYGDPVVVYNARLGKWYLGDLATGCGGQGIGLWESTNGSSWSTGACAHSGSSDDRESMWVDNNSSSPYYGRMYISWNDFSGSTAPIRLVYSDNGTSWTQLNVYTGSSFTRNQNTFGSPGSDGTVFVYAGVPGSDTVNSSRSNRVYRSTNGGASWTSLTLNGSSFSGPGDLNCSGGFPAQSPIWRDEGWGQGAVGPANVVHYVYEAHGSGGDPGDIYYSRSTDNGSTWSSPVKINSDGTARAQFKPDMAVTSNGSVVISWYDRRSTSNNDYEYFTRISTDNGLSFASEQRTSDVVIPQPLQPDSSVQACYAGDYDYHFASGNTVYLQWTDGRVQVSGNNQQDVFFDKIVVGGGQPTPTPTPTNTPPPGPTNTPTNTPVPVPTNTPSSCNSGNILTNSNFENGNLSGWTIDGHQPDPLVSTTRKHSGSYSVKIGASTGSEPNGDGSLYQGFTVPNTGGTVSFWYWPYTTDSITYDWQDAYLVNSSGTILATIMHVDQNSRTWKNVSFNLGAYAGQNVRIKFLVHEDGYGDLTYMYVDDVSVNAACSQSVPPPPADH